jgi:hypothetical protein
MFMLNPSLTTAGLRWCNASRTAATALGMLVKRPATR